MGKRRVPPRNTDARHIPPGKGRRVSVDVGEGEAFVLKAQTGSAPALGPILKGRVEKES